MSTLFKVAWVDIEDCRSAFDISRACTLRASKESRYGSVEALRLRLLRDEPCNRRALRGGDVRGPECNGGAYRIVESSSVSVSSSASSALSEYSGGRSVGSSTKTTGLCQEGEEYTGRLVTAESEESRRAEIRLRWPLRTGGEFMVS